MSTNRIHSRGPMGVEGLLIYKYLLRGDGHRACDYGAGKRPFLHAPLPLALPSVSLAAEWGARARALLPKLLLVGCGCALTLGLQLARRRVGGVR